MNCTELSATHTALPAAINGANTVWKIVAAALVPLTTIALSSKELRRLSRSSARIA